jgi:hypothetical protein
VPASLRAAGTAVFPTSGVQYALTTPGLYYVDLSAGYGSVLLQVAGARGGSATNVAAGLGGLVTGTLSSSSSVQYLALVVGGTGLGVSSSTGTASAGGTYYAVPGGYNGGGIGVSNSGGSSSVGGGGGASDVRISFGSGVADYAGSQRILVAGGGGGSTGNGGSTGGSGGYPNGATAPTSNTPPAGGGGTQTAGGTGAGTLGGFGTGGFNTGNTGWNGGGGGGWYGGSSCGQHDGGSGGSSYYNSTLISAFSSTNAAQNGPGYILLTISTSPPSPPSPPPLPPSPPPPPPQCPVSTKVYAAGAALANATAVTQLGAVADARTFALVSAVLVGGSVNGRVVNAPFQLAGAVSASNTTWIAYTADATDLKMVAINVYVSGGVGYMFAAVAKYKASQTAPFSAASISAAWSAPTSTQQLATTTTGLRYGVGNLTVQLFATCAPPPNPPPPSPERAPQGLLLSYFVSLAV